MFSNAEIAKLLREARAEKKLSQERLSAISGVPQSHISKIESGAVDLRLSSLSELARALEMELMLVPVKILPAVTSIISATRNSGAQKLDTEAQQKIYRKPAYSLADDDE